MFFPCLLLTSITFFRVSATQGINNHLQDRPASSHSKTAPPPPPARPWTWTSSATPTSPWAGSKASVGAGPTSNGTVTQESVRCVFSESSGFIEKVVCTFMIRCFNHHSPQVLQQRGLFWHHVWHPTLPNHTGGCGKGQAEAKCNRRWSDAITWNSKRSTSDPDAELLNCLLSKTPKNISLQPVQNLSSFVRMQQLVWRKHRQVKTRM